MLDSAVAGKARTCVCAFMLLTHFMRAYGETPSTDQQKSRSVRPLCSLHLSLAGVRVHGRPAVRVHVARVSGCNSQVAS